MPSPPPPDAPSLPPRPDAPSRPPPANECPIITLLGRGAAPERNEVLIGSVWIDPGAEAFDPEDGNLTAAIERDASQLDTSVPGVYRVSYEVQDSDGCVTRALRFVRVIALVAN